MRLLDRICLPATLKDVVPCRIEESALRLKREPVAAILIALLLLWARPGRADVGLPMIVVTFPGMSLAFIPIALIEMIFIWRDLQVSKLQALRLSIVANVASTLLGIPLTWICLTLLTSIVGFFRISIDNIYLRNFLSVTLLSPWLPPMEDVGGWVVPVAFMSLLVPFFYASVWSETLAIRFMLPHVEKTVIRHCMSRGNIMSYVFLLSILVVWLVAELMGYTFWNSYSRWITSK